jgi:hypothetical protein
MSLTTEKLYQLLPAIYRIRDVEQGEPLKALIAVIAEQAGVMEADILRLYENWFIETCEEWVVPYAADLLGVRGLHPIGSEAGVSLRAFVANTLRYRRRKGTATVLEQLALDITGWRARAVEFFELLGTTQYDNHIRLHNARTPDVRLTDELELLDTAFDKIAHTVDVRHIENNRGRHNIPSIGIFLWRLQSHFLFAGSARPVTEPADGRYTFNPLGYDSPLFNRPQPETEIIHLAEEINVPGLLRRRTLYDELEARRQALIDGRTPDPSYFGNQPVLQVFIQDNGIETLLEIPPEHILICDLGEPETPVPEGWLRPPTDKDYQPSDGGPKVSHPISVAVDPKRGRIAFPLGITPKQVKVGYAYGFSGDVGGGPYDRRDSVDTALTRSVDWQVGVSKEVAPKPEEIFDTLTGAIQKWNAQPPGSVGVIALLDNCTYHEPFPDIEVPEGSQLLIVAARWPQVAVPGGLPGEKRRVPGHLDPNELRPHVLGTVKVKGLAPAESLTPGEVVFDGLLVEGSISVPTGNLGGLRIAHCTLVPNNGGLKVDTGNEQLYITLNRSICGPIVLDAAISKLSVDGTIIDNGGGPSRAIEAPETPLELQENTLFGEVRGLRVDASNCIFTGKIFAERRQEGCIRFSYVPANSKPPRCFHCQPELEISRQILKAEEQGPISVGARTIIRKRVLGWLVPAFTSTRYEHYAYAQLSRTCPSPIATGADDGAEMGVFSYLKQPQREANLRTILDEYVRFGLEAGIMYVT